MKTFFTRLAIAALLLHAWSTFANAGEVVVAGGVTFHNSQPDGTWYQGAFDHTLKTDVPAVSVKWFTDSRDGWQYGVGYTFLGKVTSTAIATASDANYNTTTNSCNGACWPLSHWYGTGYVHGLTLTAKKTFSNHLFLEGGLFVNQPKWSVHIPDWIACETCVPQDVTATHNAKVQYTPTVSAGYDFGKWFMQVSIHQTAALGDEFPAIYKGYSGSAFVGFKF